jgi:hypothetical protein
VRTYEEISIFLLEAVKTLSRVFCLVLTGIARGEGAEEA